jgi:hypothetical protein
MMDAETKRLVRLNVSLRLAHLPPDMRNQHKPRIVRDVIAQAKSLAAGGPEP